MILNHLKWISSLAIHQKLRFWKLSLPFWNKTAIYLYLMMIINLSSCFLYKLSIKIWFISQGTKMMSIRFQQMTISIFFLVNIFSWWIYNSLEKTTFDVNKNIFLGHHSNYHFSKQTTFFKKKVLELEILNTTN